MTAEEFRERIFATERYVIKLAFLCPKGCRWWFHHADAAMTYLAEAIEADFYGVERPPIDTGIAHLDADIARHLKWFEARWARS